MEPVPGKTYADHDFNVEIEAIAAAKGVDLGGAQ